MKDLTTKILEELLKYFQEQEEVPVAFVMNSDGSCKVIKTETGKELEYFKDMEDVYEYIKMYVFPPLSPAEKLDLIAHEMGHGFIYNMIKRRANHYDSHLALFKKVREEEKSKGDES